jgi:hypothetical protein
MGDNKGRYGWHIDHIVPIAFGTTEEIYLLNHYTNLRPLWAMVKAAQLTEDVIQHPIYKSILELRNFLISTK